MSATPQYVYLRRLFGRFIPAVNATTLGIARAIVCSLVFLNVLLEPLPSLADLPAGMRVSTGIFSILPFSQLLLSSSWALGALQIVAALALLAGALGFKTRWSVGVSAVLFLVIQGALRSGIGAYWHCGIMPIFLLFVLAFSRCGDGFSLDARAQGIPVSPKPSRVYGFSLWMMWLCMALYYVMGMSTKLRTSGLQWLNPETLRNHILQESLAPSLWPWDFGLIFLDAPDFVLVMFAATTLLIQIGFSSVLFSRRARWFFPLAAVSLHLGIFLFMRLLFWDFLVLPLLVMLPFLERFWSSAPRVLAPRVSGENLSHSAPSGSQPHTKSAFSNTAVLHSSAVPSAFLFVGVSLLAWILPFQFYPFDNVPMYAHSRTDGIVEWPSCEAIYADGQKGTAPIPQAFPCLRNAGWRLPMWAALSPHREPRATADEFFRRVAKRWNAHNSPKIVGFEVRHNRWNYKHGKPKIAKRRTLSQADLSNN